MPYRFTIKKESMVAKKTKKQESHRQLAKYLDTLPAGYPATDTGVEIDLLKNLFTEVEAALALHMRLINEPTRVIARRAGLPAEQVEKLLKKMARKGLAAVHFSEDGSESYAIQQFVIGFWEGQVNRLDRETVKLFEAYAPIWFEQGPWKAFPQVRTIPIGESIPITTEVTTYERAETILRSKSVIAVQNCICRQELSLLDQPCGKPFETCMSFDNAAKSSIALGRGRPISLEEAFAILKQAQEAGLVLQPANSQNPIFMCACCDCCCGVLRQIKGESNPADLVMNAFIAVYDQAQCIECAACVAICPMDALVETPAGEINFEPMRCIGCGLCTSRCPTGALSLTRKHEKNLASIPKSTTGTYLRLASKRGPGTLIANGWLLIKAWFENQIGK
jgi:Na+-translocating ferredoxin:NAD+ oxidoreductase subunit B